MARVAPADVRTIVDSEVTDLAIEFAIDCANSVIAERLAGRSDTPSEATLEKIERWLAAHFVDGADPSAEQVQVGDVRITYEGGSAAGEGIAATRHGRRAIALDPTGQLENVGKPSGMFQTFGHDKDDW